MDLIVTSFDISLHCKINDFCLNQNRVSHVQFYYLYNVSPIHDCIFISVKWYGWSSTVNHRTKHVFYTYKNISSHCSNSFHKTMTFVNVKTSVRIYVHAPSQVIILWFCSLCALTFRFSFFTLINLKILWCIYRLTCHALDERGGIRILNCVISIRLKSPYLMRNIYKVCLRKCLEENGSVKSENLLWTVIFFDANLSVHFTALIQTL